MEIFWFNAPVAGLAIVLFLVAWPHGLDKTAKRRPIREFDWVGTILVIAASCLVVFGLQRGAGSTAAWNSAEVICTLVFGCLSWIALFAWAFFVRKTSIAAAFPFSILESRRICAGICFTMFQGFTMFIMIYFIPLRYQLVNLMSPSDAGVRLLPFLGSSAVFAVVAGLASKTVNRVTPAFIIAAALTMLGAGLLTTIPSTLDIPVKEYGFQVLAGAGIGLANPSISIMVSFEVPRRDYAVAQGVSGQVRILGGSIGIAAANGLLNRQVGLTLVGKLPESLIASLQSSNEAFKYLMPAQADLVREAYAQAFTETMRVCLYVAAVAFVTGFLTYTKNPPHPVAARMRKAKEDAMRREQGVDTDVVNEEEVVKQKGQETHVVTGKKGSAV